MLAQESQKSTKYTEIIATKLAFESVCNTIIILLPENTSYTTVCLVVDNKIIIYIQNTNSTRKQFLTEFLQVLQSYSASRPFYFLQADEEILATLFKTYHISELKTWFMAVPKIIDRSHPVPIRQYVLDTMQFELDVSNQSDLQDSQDFYFVELLLQHLERKIALIQRFTTMQSKKTLHDIHQLPKQAEMVEPVEPQPIIYCPECYTLFDDNFIVKIIDEQEKVRPGTGETYYCSYCDFTFHS